MGQISGELRIEIGEQHMGALESVVLTLKIAKGAEEQACSDKQKQRQHDLGGDQRLGPEA